MLTGHPRSGFCGIQVLCLTRFQYPELSVASYNKNPAALNEPDGIVAVWNLHLLERPEFVFHSQVSKPLVFLTDALINLWVAVGRPVGYVFTVSFQSCIRWHVLGANITLGHAIKAFASAENAIIGGWAHTPCVCDADGWNTKCAQPYHEQYRWHCVLVACRHACAASGTGVWILICKVDKRYLLCRKR